MNKFLYRHGWKPKDLLGKYSLLVNKKLNISNRIAFDVGCAIGIFPLKYHQNFKNIYCIDASLENINLTKQNMQKFNIENVILIHGAASNKEEEKVLIVNNKNAPYNNVVINDNTIFKNNIKPNLEEKQSYLVNTLSFNKIINIAENKEIDFLKVDIEGSEYDFLMHQDMSKIIVLAIEIHFFEEEKSQELYEFLLKSFDVVEQNVGTKHGEFLMLNKKCNLKDFENTAPVNLNTKEIKFT